MNESPVYPGVFHVYDTTLRDGAQQEGLRLTVSDKLKIARMLDGLGVTFIEGGWPGANPNDTAFFEAARTELSLRNAKLVAFGSTRRVGGSAATDPQVQALVDANTDVVCLVAKADAVHVEQALKTTLEENLEMIRDSVSYLVGLRKRVFVDAEHYFDGFRRNRGYALDVVRTAANAGAEVVILCDTNGGMLPTWIADITQATSEVGVDLGIHTHNDAGCAVANAIAAIESGAMHVQGTINGHGERAGNADLLTVIANLQLKFGWPIVTEDELAQATRVAHGIADITNVPVSARRSYVGQSAFAHKAGLHASAIKVDSNLYQHVEPERVGNSMRMLISDMAGRASIQIKAAELGYEAPDREVAARVADAVKSHEAGGYSFESADASYELLLRKELGLNDSFFDVVTWRVLTSDHAEGDDDSEAVVRLRIGSEVEALLGEGQGPLNALDVALRRALVRAYPIVDTFTLTDYRVRILDQASGTDTIVRTLIDFSDSERTWTTVGVGTNVVEASWEALVDAYRWGLVKAS